LLVTPNVVPGSPIVVTLMLEAIRSSESSLLAGATRRSVLVEGILSLSSRPQWQLLTDGHWRRLALIRKVYKQSAFCVVNHSGAPETKIRLPAAFCVSCEV
jgi:hypothetical protein